MTLQRSRQAAIVGMLAGVISLGGVAASNSERPASTTPTAPPAKTAPVRSSTSNHISYEGKDNETALALLQARAMVIVQGSGPGARVVSINGRRANALHHEYWALYVNGQPANDAADKVATRSGDQLEWKLTTY